MASFIGDGKAKKDLDEMLSWPFCRRSLLNLTANNSLLAPSHSILQGRLLRPVRHHT